MNNTYKFTLSVFTINRTSHELQEEALQSRRNPARRSLLPWEALATWRNFHEDRVSCAALASDSALNGGRAAVTTCPANTALALARRSRLDFHSACEDGPSRGHFPERAREALEGGRAWLLFFSFLYVLLEQRI